MDIYTKLKANRVLVVAIGVFLLLGLYVGYLFFGENSLGIMLQLYAKKQRLIEQTLMLEIQNANLQKQIFELRELKP